MSQVVQIELPDEFPEEFGVELRLAAAVNFYEIGRMSQGQSYRGGGVEPRRIYRCAWTI